MAADIEVLIATPDPDDHDKVMQGIADLEDFLARQPAERPDVVRGQPALFDEYHTLGRLGVGGYLEN